MEDTSRVAVVADDRNQIFGPPNVKLDPPRVTYQRPVKSRQCVLQHVASTVATTMCHHQGVLHLAMCRYLPRPHRGSHVRGREEGVFQPDWCRHRISLARISKLDHASDRKRDALARDEKNVALPRFRVGLQWF